MKNLIVFFAFFVLFDSPVLSGVDVGWLDSVEGNVVIIRGKTITQASNFISVQDGDSVIARDMNSSAKLISVNKKPISILPGSNHLVNFDLKSNYSVSGNVVTWISRSLLKEKANQNLVIASTRSSLVGNNIIVPVVSIDTKLLASPRNVHLKWNGGTPPYSLKVLNQKSHKTLFEINNINVGYAYFPGIEKIGRYAFRITDSESNFWEEEVNVVTPEGGPKMPLGDNSEGESNPALFAVWLSGVDHGSWSLEAYSYLKNNPKESKITETVTGLFERGNFYKD